MWYESGARLQRAALRPTLLCASRFSTTPALTRQALSDEYKQLAGNVEALQGEVSRLKMAAGSVVMESERRLEQLKLQYDTVRATLAREQNGLQQVIVEAINLVVMHKVSWWWMRPGLLSAAAAAALTPLLPLTCLAPLCFPSV